MKNGGLNITDALLIAYVNQELEADMHRQVTDWIAASESNTQHFNAVKKVWDITEKLEPKPVVVDTDGAWSNVKASILENETKVIPINSTRKKNRAWWGVAASILVLFGVFMLFRPGISGEVEQLAQNEVVVDELTDGTVVTLNVNSSLRYPKEFAANERRVKLQGEAFFDVERNEEKPFIVELPQANYVKVLGTSFNINTDENDSMTTVFVKTGKVEFGTAKASVILTAGEKGIANNLTGEVKKITEEHHALKSTYWIDEKLELDGVPLQEVVGILNDIFPDKIILGCPEAATYSTDSDHYGESLEDILLVIAGLHDLSVEKEKVGNDTEYVLNCNEQ